MSSNIFGDDGVFDGFDKIAKMLPQPRKEPLMELVIRYRIGHEPEPNQRTRRIRFVEDYTIEECESVSYLKIEFYDHDHDACLAADVSDTCNANTKNIQIAPDIIAEVEEV